MSIACSSEFENVKRSFKADIQVEVCTEHWDEKLLRERGDLRAKQHIAILYRYGDNVTLLGISALDYGASLSQVSAIK